MPAIWVPTRRSHGTNRRGPNQSRSAAFGPAPKSVLCLPSAENVGSGSPAAAMAVAEKPTRRPRVWRRVAGGVRANRLQRQLPASSPARLGALVRRPTGGAERLLQQPPQRAWGF